MTMTGKKIYNSDGRSSEDKALDKFAEMMIEKIKTLQNDWKKPWFTDKSISWPRNLSGREYNGMNALLLMMHCEKQGYKLPVFCTFDRVAGLNYTKDKQGVRQQIKDNNGQELPKVSILKGEKSFPVFITTFTVVDKETKEKIKYDDYKLLSEEEKKGYNVYPKLQVYNVFNVAQTNLQEARPDLYCSKICCMYTAKHAMLIRDKYPDVDVTVFYIDVRTPGKNFDEFYRRAVEEYGVHYIKGQVGKVVPQENGQLLVQASDLLDNKQILMEADMVVLAAAIEPNPDVRKIATMLTASIDTNNFLTEAHAKLRPVESPTAGIFLSGVCQGPKDIPETVSQAGAAAVKAIGLLAKDKLMTNPCTAKPDELLCNGCSTCANVCPYGAISYIDKEVNDHGIREVRRIAQVNSALCQGCGACTVACPSGSMDLQGFSNRQILAEVDAICR